MPSWKKVILSGSDAALNSLEVTTNVTATSFTGSLLGTASYADQALSASYAPGTSQTLQQVTDNGNTTTNSITASGLSSLDDVYVSSSKSYYLGANSYLRRETNGGGFENIQLNGSVRLNPNTSANANNGVVIGGNGYLLSANSSRNAQLNYGSVSGQMGIYKLNVYGADSIFQNDISVGNTVDPVFSLAGDHGIHIRPSTGQAVLRLTIGSATGSAQGAEITYKTTSGSDLSILNRASGSIALSTNANTGILNLSPTGNVSINGDTHQFGDTSNPATRLVIYNTNTSPGVIFFNDGETTINGSPGFVKYDHTDNSLSIGTNTFTGLVLDTNRKLRLNAYGSGTVTGTPAYLLAADSSGNIIETSTTVVSASYALTASFATTASYVATASYVPTLQQVTDNGNVTFNNIIITGSNNLGPDSLQINSDGFTFSGSLSGGSLNRKTHEVIYSAINFSANSTTTIAQLPAPKVAGFTFDYIAYASGGAPGGVLQAGRAGVIKGILRNTQTGVVTKEFQLNETTTLDLEDQGNGTNGLQFTIIQDTNGTSNQLVAIADNTWPYFVNYTLTIYYNPNFS